MVAGDAARAVRAVLGDLGAYSRALLPGQALRGYQLEAAGPIVDSIRNGRGRQFALVFARQSGKDELIAQLVAYLLTLYQRAGGGIVLGSPTLRPQSEISRRRALARLGNPLTAAGAFSRDGQVVGIGRAEAYYLSAAPTANARGATASLLLLANEAQDIVPDRWDAVFDPMAASTNATTVFAGTVWSDRSLLARQMRHLRTLERADGVKRVFTAPWERVAADVPAYGERVRARIAQFGREHPFIRTEYDLVELAGAGGLFGAARRAQLQGDHPRQRREAPGATYALLIDVAGEDEEQFDALDDGASVRGGRRDSTALTVIEVVQSGRGETADGRRQAAEGRATGDGTRQAAGDGLFLPPAVSRLPTYRVVDRRLWTGKRHTDLHAAIVDLARSVWGARRIVVDATGVGAGLASWLGAALPGRVVAVQFSAARKSALGWGLVGLIESGRLKEYADDGADDTRLFWRQLAEVGYEVRPGPGKLLRWGVEDGKVHDDLVLSLALVGELDGVDWRPRVARGSGGEEW